MSGACAKSWVVEKSEIHMCLFLSVHASLSLSLCLYGLSTMSVSKQMNFLLCGSSSKGTFPELKCQVEVILPFINYLCKSHSIPSTLFYQLRQLTKVLLSAGQRIQTLALKEIMSRFHFKKIVPSWKIQFSIRGYLNSSKDKLSSKW